MNYYIKKVGPEENEALLQLAHSVSTGSEQFVVDRSPSFFNLGREFGETTHFGLFRREQLIGSIAVSTQKRVLNGSTADVYYLHDLRVLPAYINSRAFYRLINGVIRAYQQETNWMFTTILDSNNPLAELLSKPRDFLPLMTKVGRMIHLGIPMFTKIRGDSSKIRRITVDEAWNVYSQLATQKNFAPLDEVIFRLNNGYFLGKWVHNEIVALCKVIDQSEARKLRASQPLSFLYRLINLKCALKGCPPLPEVGEVFRHGYLSYFVSKQNEGDYHDFLAYISEHDYASFTYVFMGLAEDHPLAKVKNPVHIKLSSSVYIHGEVPTQLSVEAQELTLI